MTAFLFAAEAAGQMLGAFQQVDGGADVSLSHADDGGEQRQRRQLQLRQVGLARHPRRRPQVLPGGLERGLGRRPPPGLEERARDPRRGRQRGRLPQVVGQAFGDRSDLGVGGLQRVGHVQVQLDRAMG